MPCDEVRTYEYGFEHVKPGIFAKALEAAGFRVSVSGDVVEFTGQLAGQWINGTWEAGRIRSEFDLSTKMQNELRVHYSTQVVKQAFGKFGWAVKQAEAVKGVKAFRAEKQGF